MVHTSNTECDGCGKARHGRTNKLNTLGGDNWFEVWRDDFEWHACSMECLKKIVDDGLPVVDTD